MPSRFSAAVLRRFAPYLWPPGDAESKRRVIIAVLFLLLQNLAGIVIPLLYGHAVDLVSSQNFLAAALLASVGAYVGVRLLRQIFEELKFYVFARVAQRAIRALALATFRRLHALSLRFHLDRQTGGLSRVIERGTKSMEFLLTFILFSIVPTLLEVIFVCAVFWWLFDWRYAVIAFVTIAAYAFFTIMVTEWRIQFRRRMNDADKRANTHAIDSLLNYETVKYFNAEEREARRYDNMMRRYEDAAVKNRTSLSLLNIGQGLVIAGGMMLIMAMAGLGVADGRHSVGLFASVNMYLLQLYMPLNFLGTVYREIRQALTDMEEMFSLLDETADVTDAADAAPLRAGGGRVEFRHVSFGYGRGGDVLHDVSFAVAGGEKLAIVGASGSGKSTIARLLYRFYDPREGDILIDGQSIRACTQQSVRAAIGVVPQDTVLFNESLMNNLLYGDADADAAAVERAAKLADIDGFIGGLPRRYDTVVGERGLKLSGGEKQRVAIARVILKNPAVLLLDEATSALDSRTEKNIQQSLNDVAKSRTTVVIAHRLSTIVDADNIIVLSAGRIVERGNHAALLAQNGAYAAMWRQQQKSTPD